MSRGKSPEWMYKLIACFVLILIGGGTVTAQDPQFSQFYALPGKLESGPTIEINGRRLTPTSILFPHLVTSIMRVKT
jgi:hypothetical protein